MKRTYKNKQGKIHRIKGPAIITNHGTDRWYINGEWIQYTLDFCIAAKLSEEDTCIMLLKYGDTLLDSSDVGEYYGDIMLKTISIEITDEIDRNIIEQLIYGIASSGDVDSNE